MLVRSSTPIIVANDLITSLFHAALTQAEIDQLVACLFDKDPLVARPASVPPFPTVAEILPLR
jgi:hypothetical protein